MPVKLSNLEKVYDPKSTEKWYGYWEEKRYFHASVKDGEDPFTITIPPPNVTGSLHMGHALNNAIQDVLIRKKRMEGRSVLWLPGTDHAGIATQNVVEKQLHSEVQAGIRLDVKNLSSASGSGKRSTVAQSSAS